MENETKTIFFFDDWLVQYQKGMERKWFSAEILPEYETPRMDENITLSMLGGSVLKEKDGTWRMWSLGFQDTSRGDEGSALYLYRSNDGINWEPDRDASGNYCVFTGEHTGGGAPFYDEREKDPSRRYKFVYVDLSPDPFELGAARTAFSPDGRNWTIDKEARWNKQHTDGCGQFVYNPYNGKYFFAGRPILGDRRVAIYQTEDFLHYEKPFVVLQPDSSDPPMTEFYAMSVVPYGGMFLGFMSKHFCGELDNGVFFRSYGRIVPELVYSINGISFQRTNRQPFIRYDPMKYGMMFAGSAVSNGDKLYIYSTAYASGHGDEFNKPKNPEMFGGAGLVIASIRKDGFCALETTSDLGEFAIRPMIYRGGDITINAQTSAYGRIRAELRTPQDRGASTPIEGFALEDSIPLCGDSCSHALRWKNGADLSVLKNKPVMLRLEMVQARVYSIEMQGIYRYGFVPLLDLSGNFIPGHWWDIVNAE